MAPTPIRNIRVPDELWEAVKHKAWLQRVDVTTVIIKFLEGYVAEESTDE